MPGSWIKTGRVISLYTVITVKALYMELYACVKPIIDAVNWQTHSIKIICDSVN